MVTLYFEVELSRERRPGTEQNRSVGLTTHVPPEDRADTFHPDMNPFAAQQYRTEWRGEAAKALKRWMENACRELDMRPNEI